ncbi:MAG: 5'-nucleotidase [Pseudomonadota bacterium]|nr:5'-nucleotidase [Pseudomonadota bacterium]
MKSVAISNTPIEQIQPSSFKTTESALEKISTTNETHHALINQQNQMRSANDHEFSPQPYSLDQRGAIVPRLDNTVVAVSSGAIFDFSNDHKIAIEHGSEAYDKYQIEHEDDILEKGEAFNLCEKMFAVNEQLKAIGSDLRFDVVITSKNTPDACMRALKSAEHYNLPINRTAFTNGASPYQYTKAFGTSLFLTTNAQDAKEAVNEGVPAAQILPSNQKEQSSQLRVALDGDAVVFGDSSEKISFEKGLEGFYQHEQQNKNTPIEKGPLFPFLYRLSLLKKEFPKEKCPIRIAITTARAAPAAERLIKTLRNWGIEIDELHLLGGMNKGPFLEAFQADIFLDDNIKNAQQGSAHVVSGHVHFGINNQSKA